MAQELFVSLESTHPDASGESFAAGIVAIDPLAPPRLLIFVVERVDWQSCLSRVTDIYVL
jgi:hypothetical protein